MIWPFNANAKQIKILESQIIELKEKGKSLENRILQFQDNLSQTEFNTEKEVENLNFRNKKNLEEITREIKIAISKVNNEAFSTKTEMNDTQFIVDDFEIELKGGLSIENNGIHLTQLISTELNPQSVSTVKFKLTPKIKTKISD